MSLAFRQDAIPSRKHYPFKSNSSESAYWGRAKTPPIGIIPTVDFAFKLVFGSPEHIGITIHFLNAILGDAVRITDVEFQNPYLGKAYQNDKWIVLDILATDNLGRRLNVEIQTTLPEGILQRLTYYDARLYVDQIQEGEKYERLRPAIMI